MRRLLSAAIGLGLTLAQPAAAYVFDARLFSLSADFYRVMEAEALLELRDCGRPCPLCRVELDMTARVARFEGAQCAITRQFREIEFLPGLHDASFALVGPGLYAVRGGHHLFESPRCAMEAEIDRARIVYTHDARRLLFDAPDHPDASVTGRVVCAVVAVYGEVAF